MLVSNRGFAHLLILIGVVVVAVTFLISQKIGTPQKPAELAQTPESVEAEIVETSFTIGFNMRGAVHYGYNDILPYTRSEHVDQAFSELKKMKGQIVRVFAPNNKIGADEAARRLDQFLTKAEKQNIQVIVALIDFYNTGYNPSGTDRFYTNTYQYDGLSYLNHEFFLNGYRNEYKNFVRTVVTKNRHHTSIYAWEIGNELKDEGSPQTLVNFMRDMSASIKSWDPNHKVATGMINAAHTASTPDEFYPQLGSIDIITIHPYNGDRTSVEDIVWARNNGKIGIVEEIGFAGNDARDQKLRNEVEYFKLNGATAALYWGFVPEGVPDNGDGDTQFGMDTFAHSDYQKLSQAITNINSQYICRVEFKYPECNWNSKQVRDVYQNTCTGVYTLKNERFEDGNCGYKKPAPAPTYNNSGKSCIGDGQKCSKDSECCSGDCSGNQGFICAKTLKNTGEKCTQDNECKSGDCWGGGGFVCR